MVSKIYKNLRIFGIQHISLLTIPTTIVVCHVLQKITNDDVIMIRTVVTRCC
jgi:hypothetical protein